MINRHRIEKLGEFAPHYLEISDWVENVLDDVKDVLDQRVEEITDRSDLYSLFKTSTAPGGIEATGYGNFSTAHSTGFIPELIKPYIERDIKACQDAWDEIHPDHKVSDLLTAGPRTTEQETLLKEYDEHKEAWFQDTTYFYKVRALFYRKGDAHNVSGESEIYLAAGINDDFEYGRDYVPYATGGTHWVWKRTVLVRDITPELLQECYQQATEALAKA